MIPRFFKNTYFIILFIFLFSLTLRSFNLGSIPYSLHTDEVYAGYQGNKIVKTGSDIFGNHLPLYIDKFGDYRPAGIFYIVGLFTSTLGLNDFTIRFPVAVIGSLTVIPLYLLVLLLFNNKKIAFISSLLLAISPWHIIASRSTSESIISLSLVIGGVTWLMYALKRGKEIFFLFSFLLLILSYFFYPTPRVFVPAFLIFFAVFILFARRLISTKLNKFLKGKYLYLMILIVVVITFAITFTKFGTGRFNQTSIFANKDIRSKIKILEDGHQGDILTARIFHNKLIVYSKEFLDQYLSYFSIQYLYVKGGFPHRYIVNEAALFYYIELPLFLTGLFFLIKKREFFFFVPIIWVMIGPLAASLTTEDSPNIQRSIFMLPSFQIIEAYGIYFLLESLREKKKYSLTAICIAFLINGIYFFDQYFVHSPSHVAYSRNDGNERLFAYLNTQIANYDKIYLPVYGDLPVYYYYYKKDKSSFLSISRFEYENGFKVGKYIFVPDECPENKINLQETRDSVLIVDYGNCKTNPILKHVSTVYRKDSAVAFTISEL